MISKYLLRTESCLKMMKSNIGHPQKDALLGEQLPFSMNDWLYE